MLGAALERLLNRPVDYDRVAKTYYQRYERNTYGGVERTLLDCVGANTGQRVLEVGCGTGYWLSLLARQGFTVAGVDASRGMLSRATRRVPEGAIVCGWAEQLPWASESFDRVVCINAFHHFLDRKAFLSEARRVLRKDGVLMTVGLDPHTGLDRWFVYDYFNGVLEFDRLRFLPTQQIRELMRLSGFSRCHTIEAEHLALRLPARIAIEDGRLDRMATSQLAALTQEEYQRGINRISREIERSSGQLELVSDLRLYATIGWSGSSRARNVDT